MTTEIYIVEEHFNDYDQHGGVTLAVFGYEPTDKDLKFINNGEYTSFGRKDDEYSWVECRIVPYIQYANQL